MIFKPCPPSRQPSSQGLLCPLSADKLSLTHRESLLLLGDLSVSTMHRASYSLGFAANARLAGHSPHGWEALHAFAQSSRLLGIFSCTYVSVAFPHSLEFYSDTQR